MPHSIMHHTFLLCKIQSHKLFRCKNFQMNALPYIWYAYDLKFYCLQKYTGIIHQGLERGREREREGQ